MKSKEYYDHLLGSILDERLRQDAKWGITRNLSNLKWLGILLEEIGEVAKAIIEGLSWDIIEGELIQCIAVIFSWIEDKDNSNHAA